MDKKKPTLAAIFVKMLTISAFTFGGGFVITSLMKKEFVDKKGWLSENEILDYVAIAQSCPGSIAVNAAILVGYELRGMIGMFVSTLGTIIPPMLILSIVSVFYNAFSSSLIISLLLKGMQAGVAAIILDVVISLGDKVVKSRSALNIAIMIIAFILSVYFKVNVNWIILTVLLIGALKVLIERKKVSE